MLDVLRFLLTVDMSQTLFALYEFDRDSYYVGDYVVIDGCVATVKMEASEYEYMKLSEVFAAFLEKAESESGTEAVKSFVTENHCTTVFLRGSRFQSMLGSELLDSSYAL